MIVNPTETGWEVIYQRAHGLLAGQIAAHWRVAERPERWFETLIAVTEHDDGGREWEGANHLTEAGAPLDFRLSKLSPLVQARDVTNQAQHKGQWVALLISMHTSFLYGDWRDKDDEVAAFLDEQETHQTKWRKALNVSKANAEAAYTLLHWADQMSLILCQRHLPQGERALEVSKGPDGTRYDVRQRDDGTLCVTPWPFEEATFTVTVEATYLHQFDFENDEALLDALRNGEIRPLQWSFSKQS